MRLKNPSSEITFGLGWGKRTWRSVFFSLFGGRRIPGFKNPLVLSSEMSATLSIPHRVDASLQPNLSGLVSLSFANLILIAIRLIVSSASIGSRSLRCCGDKYIIFKRSCAQRKLTKMRAVFTRGVPVYAELRRAHGRVAEYPDRYQNTLRLHVRKTVIEIHGTLARMKKL